MSANFLDQRTFKLLTALVALLAVPTMMSWVATPQEFRLVEKKSAKQFRGLASIGELMQPESNSKAGQLSRPILLEWNLGQKTLVKEVDATHLRLKGMLKKGQTKSIQNETNGFTAAVFGDENGYSTDFIELKEGTNTISVEWVDGKGKNQKSKIEINRRMPASL